MILLQCCEVFDTLFTTVTDIEVKLTDSGWLRVLFVLALRGAMYKQKIAEFSFMCNLMTTSYSYLKGATHIRARAMPIKERDARRTKRGFKLYKNRRLV